MTYKEGVVNYLTLNSGGRICYETIDGDQSKACLVFLHEGLGCIPMWRDFPRQLCRHTGCPGLVYDRNGYGRSSPLKAPRTIHHFHDSALNELPQVLDALIPGRPFILVGHSDGGTIALIYGAEQHKLLKGIVTEAAHVFVEDATITGIERADEAYEAGKFKGLHKYHGDKTHTIFKAWSDTWRFEWFRHWNIEYLLPSIKCPVLAAQGVDDQYGTKGQLDAIAGKAGGLVEPFMVKDCGHIPHLDQPGVMIDAMSKFIARIKGC